MPIASCDQILYLPAMENKTPKTMWVAQAHSRGGPEVLNLWQQLVPQPKKHEVLIRVKAAGINRPDLLQRKGLYPPPPGASKTLGLEVAGLIERLGPGVREYAYGQRVCALLSGGGYAEFAVAPVETVLNIPNKLTFAEAAALPETFFTAWSALFDLGQLAKGQTVLIHGGASGVGVAAIQLAASIGAKVMATAGTEIKTKLCKRLGAIKTINYKRQDFVSASKVFTRGKGLDLILDIVGGDYIQRNLNALGMDGRLVFLSFLKGARAELDLRSVLMKRLTITGATLRARPLAYKKSIRNHLLQSVWPLITTGKIKSVIDTVYPLAKAADAHRRMESGVHAGKIVLLT